MDRLIDLKQERKDNEALSIIRTNRGKLLMDEINLFASGIVRAADDRVASGVLEQRYNASRVRYASIAAALLIALVVGGVVVTVYRYTREITAARDQVSALNASLESRVADRTVELARANEEVRRFTHIVSHDLRAPLVNIVGFAGEIEASLKALQTFVRASTSDPISDEIRAAVNEELPEALEFIRSSTQKMDRLINAILKVSREGQRQVRPEQIALDKMFEATLAAIHHQLSEDGGTCVLDLQIRSLVTDKLSLEQILGNLLDNAVKYRSKDRPLRIIVRTRLDERERMCLEISDNGRGIAARDVERVFELFKRVGPQDQPGEGVGLAHVQALVSNLGGTIHVTSEYGSGTTFRIVLPLRAHTINSERAA
jgi:signal transduction histidine kinase